jgi:ABC-type transport system involved in cytochrome c biogenesis permease subunit
MKKYLPLLALLFGLGMVGAALVPPQNSGAFDLVGFSRLPVLVNGRIKPLDTVARTSLLVLQGRQRVSSPESEGELTPIEWLPDVLFKGEVADKYRTIAIDNLEVLALVGRNDDNLTIKYESGARKVMALLGFLPSRYRRFTFAELEPYLATIDEQAQLAERTEDAARSPFQKGIVQLRNNLVLYERLKTSFVSADTENFAGELTQFQAGLTKGIAAVRAKQANQPHDEAAARQMLDMGQRFMMMERTGYLLTVPPATGSDPSGWQNTGAALLGTFQTGSVPAIPLTFAYMAQAWREGKPEQFNQLVKLYRDSLEGRFAVQLKKSDLETRFNAAEPFYKSMLLYAGAFFLAVASWLRWPAELGRAAFFLVAIAFATATAGILTRMWLEGRPPVTNLYSSALFVGWGAVGLCLVLESVYKNSIGSVAAGMIGFCTLLIAHHLSLAGDTLEMMRAVLDSNFWLATHVVVVTTGYAATFLAGFLALIYVIRGVFTSSLDRATADSLNRMVYGIVCFATLFSLVGTILGGIWADQSWGRFWGWDPKENGALIIVIWNAIILHARWGGLVKQRGLMALAIIGNIVTSWSWFGVNMLGVGLHSYGFMDQAFWWLIAFVATQVALVIIANLPLEKWRSFRTTARKTPMPATAMAK